MSVIKPQVGDTIIIEGIVTGVSGGLFSFETTPNNVQMPYNQKYGHTMHISRIKEIIPKPWEPKTGDLVHKIGDVIPDYHYTVLTLHGSGDRMTGNRTRKWVVAAHKDDIPQIFWLSEIECVV